MPTATPSRRHRLLIINDEPTIGVVAEEVFNTGRYELRQAPHGAAGLRQIEDWCPDVVLLDHRLPDQCGLEWLPRIASRHRDLPILFISASRSAATTIEAVRQGAFDYLPKPLQPEALKRRVEDALESRRLLRTPVISLDGGSESSTGETIVGQCDGMRRVYKAIGRVAAFDSPVVIQGETGTGKRTIARAIHCHSARHARPFKCIQCEEWLPDELDALLFGSDEASGASMIKQCAGGTVLLHEVGALTLATQSRLLQVIRGRAEEDDPTGNPDLPVILFSTSHDLGQLVAERRIHSDLFYELCGDLIRVPPLRQRDGDIPLLVDHFIRRLSRIGGSLGGAPARVSEQAMRMLLTYPWPGNVTELKSVLRRSHMENGGAVVATNSLRDALASPVEALSAPAGEQALPREPATPALEMDATRTPPYESREAAAWSVWFTSQGHRDAGNLYAEAVEQMERGLIPEVLARTGGNLTATARMLGITRVSLRKKIYALSIEVPGRGVLRG